MTRSLPRILAVAAITLWSVSAPAEEIDDWRESIVRTRSLADNDAKKAYTEAQRLEQAIPSGARDADRAAILNLLSRIETYLSMTDAAIAHAESARELARRSEDRIGQLEADLNLAPNYVNLGRIDDLLAVTTHGMTLIDGADRPELVIDAMMRMATAYGRIGDFDSSVTLPMQAMDIAERSRAPLALAYAHYSMAVAIAQTGRSHEALDHYKSMREHARRANSRLMEHVALRGMGNSLSEQGKAREGEPMIREAVAFFRAFGGPFYLASGLTTLAYNLKHQKRNAEAASVEAEVFSIYESRGNRIGLWWLLNSRSADRQAAGRLAEAAADARRAHELADQIGTAFYKSRSARRVADVAAAQGDFRTAYRLSAEASDMADQAARERSGTRMSELGQRYRTEAKQREIEALEHRNEEQAEEQRSLWIFLFGSFAVIAWTAYLLLRLQHSHRMLEAANAHLRRTENDVRALNVSLEQRVQERTGELRKQARYLRTLIDMLPMWAWFKDTQSRYLVANQAHSRAFGLDVAALVGKSDFNIVPKTLAQSQLADDIEVMSSGERRTTEERLPDGDAWRWMEIYKAPVVDEDGSLLGTVGFARDVSERKAAEDARNAALAEAERLAQVRSDFIAQMSHELRTPLSGVLGYAELLANDAELDERHASRVAVIRQCGEQLLTLINDVLDMAKIEAGKLEVRCNDIPLHAFLRGIADTVGVRAEQKGLQFACELAPDTPEAIHVDERLLRQVLLNLLANAIKFTERGVVSLRVAREGPGRLRFTIEDTGVGIAPDHLKRIFRPFEQTEDGRARNDGSGLGLAISRRFVERLGGEIHVSSQPGKGSAFWFDLAVPDAHLPAEAAAAPRSVCGYEGPRKRILVVDDVPESRTLFGDMLEPLGFAIEQARDGIEALNAAQSMRPDLVVIDNVMPKMDGFEFTRQLRKTPGFERMPIIAVSASASALDRANSLAMGATDFLAKPVQFDVLIDRIGTLLGLAWTYRDADALAPQIVSAEDRLFAPPQPEGMDVLHRLALEGSMHDVARHAEMLLKQDARYHAFARRLQDLATRFQSRAILELVMKHMDARS